MNEDANNGKKRFNFIMFINNTRTVFNTVIAFLVMIIGTYLLLTFVTDKKLYIAPFSIPDKVKNSGYTSDILSQIYLDEINSFVNNSKTLYTNYSSVNSSSHQKKNAEITPCKLFPSNAKLNIPFVGVEMSVGSTTTLLQRIFGISPNILTGYISLCDQDTLIELNSRYESRNPVVIKGKLSNLKQLVKKSVEKQFMNLEPYYLAFQYEEQNRDEECVLMIKYMLKNPPHDDNKWAYNLWGVLLLKYKWYDEAETKFKSAIKLDSLFFLPYYNLGIIEHVRGNYDKAIKYFDKTIFLNEEFSGSYYGKSSSLMSKRDYSNALLNINIAIKTDEEASEYYYRKGQIQYMMNDDESAVLSFLSAIEKNNNCPEYFCFLGIIKNKQHDTLNAKQLFEHAYTIDKFYPAANQCLYEFYQSLIKDTIKALKYKNVYDSLIKAEISSTKDLENKTNKWALIY